MKQISILGIDGAGKSTIAFKLAKNFNRGDKFRIFSCPSYHDIGDSGNDMTSSYLEHINKLGNNWELSELKALALFLQMSLYKSVQIYSKKTFNPDFLIAERHPIIDTIVYSNIYIPRLKGMIDRKKWEPIITEEMNKFEKFSFKNILSEFNKVNHNPDYDFWNYTSFLKKILSGTWDEKYQNLSNIFNVEMPEVIIFLDVRPEEAIRRLEASGNKLELHETVEILKVVRKLFLETLDIIKEKYPTTKISIVQESDFNNTYDQVEKIILTL